MAIKVEKYVVSEPAYKIVIDGQIHRLSHDETNELFEQLSKCLNKPPTLRFKGCDNRYSHGPHAWGADGLNYCMGHSFDQT